DLAKETHKDRHGDSIQLGDAYGESSPDDSAVVGLITEEDEREYRGLIQNNLQINASKTKELMVDFRRT
ncbi:hypothetical protein L3Q82_025065, partial [Scortum barcoo]